MKRHRILVKPLHQHADPATIGLSDDTAGTDFRARIIAQRVAVGTARTLADLRASAGTNKATLEGS